MTRYYTLRQIQHLLKGDRIVLDGTHYTVARLYHSHRDVDVTLIDSAGNERVDTFSGRESVSSLRVKPRPKWHERVYGEVGA